MTEVAYGSLMKIEWTDAMIEALNNDPHRQAWETFRSILIARGYTFDEATEIADRIALELAAEQLYE